ncbi:MAG: hypothetical protein ABI040_01635 [Rhodoferax sp.]
MKVTFKGYDPDLGRKFMQDYGGLVIGRAKSAPSKSEEQVRQEWIEEHGREPDAQQLHDAMLAESWPQITKLADAPTRDQFATQEQCEQALGAWQSRTGRIAKP